MDLPWSADPVRPRVHVRTFFCDNPDCTRRIVAERLAEVAAASARRTDRQAHALTAISVALGGEAGARFAHRQDAAAAAGVARRRANDDRARALHAGGMGVAEIARTVGISRMTVSECLRDDPAAQAT